MRPAVLNDTRETVEKRTKTTTLKNTFILFEKPLNSKS